MATISPEYLAVIQRCNKYFGSGMEGEVWRLRPHPMRFGLTVADDSHGLVLPDVAEEFRKQRAELEPEAEPWSSWFGFDDENKALWSYAVFDDIQRDATRIPGQPFGKLDRYVPESRSTCWRSRFYGDGSSSSCWHTRETSARRNVAGILGIVSRSYHINVYCETKQGIRIMVRKTAAGRFLPSTVTNMMEPCMNESYTWPLSPPSMEGIARDTMRLVESGGQINYCNIRPEIEGPGFAGRPEPGVAQVYDFKVKKSWRPDFFHSAALLPAPTVEFLPVHQVRAALINAQFPPLAGLVMLDFLVRHQLLDVDAEEMRAIHDRLHEPLPFGLGDPATEAEEAQDSIMRNYC
ncbi:hypothetical protein C8A01DRAFT_41145 [Parachaetomium inaequale]|uniref:Uncharacterized protein n=1 Tax=Parachaetomium inaequale TaxID=2588326 RepID=A0AAN6P5Z7_9PEZI|nr:hypothetical protein C8A01DRAFT_41145 [Parachaetomium inaequale]